MLKKSKIIAMTKLAIYEKHKGEEALEITRYYREDYISNRILQGIIRYTAVFFLLSLMYLLMQAEELLMKMSFPFLLGLGRRAVLFYLLGLTFFVAVFLFFSYFSYEKALEVRKEYEQSLEEILSLSYSFGKDKRPGIRDEAEESSTRTAKKEVQDIILQMKKEGERLDFTPLSSRDREGKSEKESKLSVHKEDTNAEKVNIKRSNQGSTSRKVLQKIDLEDKKDGLDEEDWLDKEDWLDE